MVMKGSAATPEVRTITAAEFKAKCLQLMDEVNETGLTLVITKRGKPVMQAIAPAAEQKPFRSIFGRSVGIKVPSFEQFMKARAAFADDWADPGEKWARTNPSTQRKKRKNA